jgi:surface protein
MSFTNETLKKAVKLWISNESECLKLHGDISTWDTSEVTNMNYLFCGHSKFNRTLNWDTSKVTNMRFMFCYAHAFDQVLTWDVSNVVDAHFMFRNTLVAKKYGIKSLNNIPLTHPYFNQVRRCSFLTNSMLISTCQYQHTVNNGLCVNNLPEMIHEICLFV